MRRGVIEHIAIQLALIGMQAARVLRQRRLGVNQGRRCTIPMGSNIRDCNNSRKACSGIETETNWKLETGDLKNWRPRRDSNPRPQD